MQGRSFFRVAVYSARLLVELGLLLGVDFVSDLYPKCLVPLPSYPSQHRGGAMGVEDLKRGDWVATSNYEKAEILSPILFRAMPETRNVVVWIVLF